MTSKFIFVTGGVVSSLGKGITAASLASLLQCHGYTVRLRKLDPYLNVDPGTMSPFQHGEVFVTDDGQETDLDLGHYERFTGINTKASDNTTAGKIYLELLNKERRGDYLGKTVQVIPHVTDLIKNFITNPQNSEDFIICEIGGTVGDIEAEPFIEAIRQLSYELGSDRVMFVHLTLVPYLKAAKELKTKPTQHSVRELRSRGIQPQVLICRSEKPLPKDERDKIALFCNISKTCVFEALDQKSIYNVVLDLHSQGLDREVLNYFKMPATQADVSRWTKFIQKLSAPKHRVNIGIIAKYESLADSYKSLIEAFTHAGVANDAEVNLVWVSSDKLSSANIASKLEGIDGILVPGGFGSRGVEGKILAINFARTNNIPFFGICLGMQLAAIEYCRNVLGIDNASSSEFDSNCTKVIARMSEWEDKGETIKRYQTDNMGGTMRLGSFACELIPGSLAHSIYSQGNIDERHRHRYEFNISYKQQLEDAGLTFSGMSPDGSLAEIIEIVKHPFFIAVQFHPELKSRPFAPHPIFTAFIKAALDKSQPLQ